MAQIPNQTGRQAVPAQGTPQGMQTAPQGAQNAQGAQGVQKMQSAQNAQGAQGAMPNAQSLQNAQKTPHAVGDIMQQPAVEAAARRRPTANPANQSANAANQSANAANPTGAGGGAQNAAPNGAARTKQRPMRQNPAASRANSTAQHAAAQGAPGAGAARTNAQQPAPNAPNSGKNAPQPAQTKKRADAKAKKETRPKREKPKTEASERARLRRRRRLRQLLGAAVCLLVVIGLLSTVSGSIRFVGTLFDDTAEREEFAGRIQFVTALDPLPFETLSDASMATLLDAAIWATVNGTNNEDYEHDELGATYLPTADLDKTISALYGPDIKFNYATFEDGGLTYNYVPERQAYLVPITSAPSNYVPLVRSIKREGRVKRLTVGYDSPYDDVEMPVKYMDYLFTKNTEDGGYYLTGIVTSETRAETAASSSEVVVNSAVYDTQDTLNQAAADILADGAASSSEADASQEADSASE